MVIGGEWKFNRSVKTYVDFELNDQGALKFWSELKKSTACDIVEIGW